MNLRALALAGMPVMLGLLPARAADVRHHSHSVAAAWHHSSDFGTGASPLEARAKQALAHARAVPHHLGPHRFGATGTSPLIACQSLYNSTIIANGRGLITGPVLNAALSCPLISIVPYMGSFNGTTWTPNIPPGSISAAMIAAISGQTIANAGGVIAQTPAGGDVGGTFGALTVNKIGGQAPAPSATIDATNGINVNVTVPGGASRSVLARAQDALNALDYGVSTANADNSAALTAWANALASYASTHSGVGPQGFIPCGIYRFSMPVVFPVNKLALLGMGACTEFDYTGPAGTTAFDLQMPNAYTTGAGIGTILLQDFRLYRTTPDISGGIGIHVVNPTSYRQVRVDVTQFDRQVVQEGGDNNHYVTDNLRSGDYQSTLQPNSGLLDLEPFVWTAPGGATTVACPTSVDIEGQNFGGPNTQFGVKVGCIDGLYMGTGHIGAGLVNDVEIDRIKGQGAQSIEISGYLDNAQRAVYLGAPTGSGSDANGAGAYAIRIHPYQIANSTGNAIESEDPTADIGVFGTHFFGVSGWGVYAPYAAHVQIGAGNEFENVGFGAGLNAGGIEVGLVQTTAAGTGTAGSVGSLLLMGNAFFGTTYCGYYANVTEYMVASNLIHDCSSATKTNLAPASN